MAVLLSVIAIAAAFAGYIYIRGVPNYDTVPVNFTHAATAESIERGRKLTLTLCAGCHMNIKTGKLSGRHMSESPPEFGYVYSANITGDQQYGIGSYSDGELVYLLRTGIKRSGQYAPAYMAKLPHLADEDMNAIISFLRSDQPEVQPEPVAAESCRPSLLTKFLCYINFKPLPMPADKINLPDTSDAVATGKYLAHNLDCFTCHSGDFTRLDILHPEETWLYFGGGNKPLDYEGKVVLTSNITPDEETGIGNWTEEQFVRALRYGIKEGEPSLRYPMVPYVHLTDKEAAAIFAYLKTIPPIKNKIDRQF